MVRVVPLLFTRVSTEVEGLAFVVRDEPVVLVVLDVVVVLLVLDVLCALPLVVVVVEGLAVADVLVVVVLFSTSLRNCAALFT